MRLRTLLAVGAVMLPLCTPGTPATAGMILHDNLAMFANLTGIQGPDRDGDAVAAGRSRLRNMFDRNAATMYSLGWGGSLSLTVTPLENVITSGSVIEVTNAQGATQRSAVEIALGINGAGWVTIGQLVNRDVGGPDGIVSNLAPAIALLSTVPDASSRTSTFSLSVLSGEFNSLRFLDVTASLSNSREIDGFSIAELRVTSVPEPAALTLLGLGLLGLTVVMRRGAVRTA